MTCISASLITGYYVAKKSIGIIKDEEEGKKGVETVLGYAKLGAAPAVITSILGPAAASACLIIASAGGIRALKSLRKYELEERQGKYILKK